nr:fibronectin type III-like domain-contianing protein [Oceanicoccus sp. KOV_DT_Chl]
MAGPAIAELLLGEQSPSGRLPITWPLAVGQIPIYYNHKNTGRPANDKDFVAINDIPVQAWQSSLGNDSHYLDLGFRPAFPFGFGLTYSEFSYQKLQLSNQQRLSAADSLEVSVLLKNIGDQQATEVVQLYIQDVVADVTRPVRELKGFQRVSLAAGEQRRVLFTITPEMLKFHNQQMQYVIEPGRFNVWVGPDAASGLSGSFIYQE